MHGLSSNAQTTGNHGYRCNNIFVKHVLVLFSFGILSLNSDLIETHSKQKLHGTQPISETLENISLI